MVEQQLCMLGQSLTSHVFDKLMSFRHSFPVTTAFRTVNRACASSLQSISDIAASIQTHQIDMGIAAGVESMTKDYGVSYMT